MFGIAISWCKRLLWWGVSQFTRPALLENYKYPAPRAFRRLLCLHWCKRSCPGVSAVRGMESTFWSLQVKQAWDSVPQVQEAQSPLPASFSEDHGPWPLPFYPVLGLFPSHSGDFLEQPLPVWIGDFAGIYPMTSSCGIQRTWEPSIPDSVSAVHDVQQEKIAIPGTREDTAEEPFTVEMHPGSCSRELRGGDDAKDPETSGGSSFRDFQQPARRDWRSRL